MTKLEIEYLGYQPDGYTDDLGIIADRNQWIPERPAGWHVYNINPNDWYEVREWLDENNIWHETHYSRLVLKSESDVTLFMLRWC